MRTAPPRALAATVAALVLVAGCGGGDDSGNRRSAVPPVTGGTVYIYSNLRGAPARERDSMAKAIRLAIDGSGGHAGLFTVRWRELNHSASPSGAWTEEQVDDEARAAADNKRTLGFIGEFDSEATKIAVPILNRAGISVVSPASTYVGLTTNEDPGRPKGDPERFYPSKQRTFARLIPRDTVQAAALVSTMKRDGCKKAGFAADGSDQGERLARLVQREAKDSGVSLQAKQEFTAKTSARDVAATVKQQNANCFLLAAGTASADAARLYRAVFRSLGAKAHLYGTNVLCDRGFAAPPGMPVAVGRRYACVLPTIPVTALPAASSFLNSYRRKWDETPSAYAVYAYEAMKLYLDTIEGLGSLGSDRESVASALHATGERRSALGTYSIDINGDTTSTAYALYRVGARGGLRFAETVRPTVR